MLQLLALVGIPLCRYPSGLCCGAVFLSGFFLLDIEVAYEQRLLGML